VTYETDYLIQPHDFNNLRNAAGSPPPAQVVLEGILAIESDQNVRFYLSGSTRGYNQLFVNNVAVRWVGEGKSSSSSQVPVNLRRGSHQIRWVLTGTSDFGIASLRVTDSTGAQLPLTVDSRLRAAAERPRTKTRLHFGHNPP
jgi:hypothetical protein